MQTTRERAQHFPPIVPPMIGAVPPRSSAPSSGEWSNTLARSQLPGDGGAAAIPWA